MSQDTPQPADALAREPAPTGAPILEAVHLQKHFPVRQFRLFGRPQVVHAVEDTSLAIADMRDAHRVLVGPADRLDNVGQLRRLLSAGYAGPISFEPFAAELRALGGKFGFECGFPHRDFWCVAQRHPALIPEGSSPPQP